MKYLRLGLVVAVVLALSACGAHKPASQSDKLLQVQQKSLASSVVQEHNNVTVIMPREKGKHNLVTAKNYVAAAKKELGKVTGQTQSKAAYVTFTGQKSARNFVHLQPVVSVYQRQKRATKLVARRQLASVNVDTQTGKAVTAGSLMRSEQQLKAINYHALAEAVAHKQYTDVQLTQARGITFMKNMAAQNFNLSSKYLTIFPAQNPLHIKAVKIPLTQIKGYLDRLYTVAEPNFGKEKVVALSFDDGPNPKTTPTVLKTLKQEHIKATFFMVGYEVAANPALARSVVQAGNEVGTHTFDHKNLAVLDPASAYAEVEQSANAMYHALGTLPLTLRPPYGAVNKAHDSTIPLPSIQWAVDSEDWRVHAPAPIIARINRTVYPGAIILMHDIHPQSVAALPQVIRTLKAKGYRFVTVNQLLGKYLLPEEQYFGAGDHRSI